MPVPLPLLRRAVPAKENELTPARSAETARTILRVLRT